MRPTVNTIHVVSILWRDARHTGGRDAWRRLSYELGAIRLYLYEPLKDQQGADFHYLNDMQDEALDMMENCK